MFTEDDVNLIIQQTHVDDVTFVRECLLKCNGNVVDAIMLISNLRQCVRETQNVSDHEKHMQQIRSIVNEKEDLYHDAVAHIKKNAQE